MPVAVGPLYGGREIDKEAGGLTMGLGIDILRVCFSSLMIFNELCVKRKKIQASSGSRMGRKRLILTVVLPFGDSPHKGDLRQLAEEDVSKL